MTIQELELLNNSIRGLGGAFERRHAREEGTRQFDLTRQDKMQSESLDAEMKRMQLGSQGAIAGQKLSEEKKNRANRVWNDTIKMQAGWVKDGIMQPDNAVKAMQGLLQKMPEEGRQYLADNPSFLAIQSGDFDFNEPPPKVGSPSDIMKMLGEQRAAVTAGDQEAADVLGNVLGNKTRPTPSGPEQNNARMYADRLESNDEIITSLEGKGFDPAAVGAAIPRPNVMKGPEQQSYEAAKKNWIAAVLRKESGASIAPHEFQGADEQYFPQFGDSPQVRQQKAALRKQVGGNMRKAAGPEPTQQQPSEMKNVVPEAPQDAAMRQPGIAYQTPKGVLKWTGTGWIKP